MKRLDRYADYAYALLRIVAGLMFSFHGAQKLFGLFAANRPPMGTQLWVAGIIELIGGLAVMLGLGTRVAAFICSGEMAVAYFQIHWRFQLSSQLFPIMNKGELAVLYCFIFLLIAVKGGVKWSLDKKG
jgi:putative oxidoreductase